MKRVALYMRVSSSDQKPETQLYDLQQLVCQRGYEVVKQYTDKISGAKARRPALDELLADARRRRFDVVMVGSLSDVARSVKHCLELLNQLNQFGVGFVSCREHIDTTNTTMGQAMAVIVRGLVNLERNVRIANVKAGMRRAALDGVKIGRTPLSVDRAAIVRDRLCGMSLTAVGKKYGVSRGTVCRLVKLAGGQPDSLLAVNKIPPPPLDRHELYPTFQVHPERSGVGGVSGWSTR